MDIAVIKEALSNFNTFVDNIADLFRGLPNFLSQLIGFFTTPEGADESPASAAANATSSIFGGGEEGAAEGGSSEKPAE